MFDDARAPGAAISETVPSWGPPPPPVCEVDPAAVEAAFAPGAIKMVHQPIVDLNGGDVLGYEALARFALLPRLPPDQWFEAAARAGRRVELELMALDVALASLADIPPGCFLCVNASPETALDPGFAKQLQDVALERVVLEITEQARIDSYELFAAALAPLRARGMRLAIDDLGAGFASLNHLLRLEPDLVKLDRCLTRDIDRHRPTRALAAALTSFAMETGMVVVAEGIETVSQRSVFHALGVSLGQGYLLGKPEALRTTVAVPQERFVRVSGALRARA